MSSLNTVFVSVMLMCYVSTNASITGWSNGWNLTLRALPFTDRHSVIYVSPCADTAHRATHAHTWIPKNAISCTDNLLSTTYYNRRSCHNYMNTVGCFGSRCDKLNMAGTSAHLQMLARFTRYSTSSMILLCHEDDTLEKRKYEDPNTKKLQKFSNVRNFQLKV